MPATSPLNGDKHATLHVQNACCLQVTAIDVTDDTLERARRRAEAAGPATSDNITFMQVIFSHK